ncbi:MAG: trypsin-like peptidase domain-containing protein [Phycisphaerales bacterium]
MRRLWHALALACVVSAMGGCTITGLEETATRQAWPADAEAVFGCTPVIVDFFGGRIRGSGSGVFVSDRWLLTAAHVVPDDAQYAWISSAEADAGLGVVMPVEIVMTGGGEPVESGDWALVRFPEIVDGLGSPPARLLDGRFEAARAVLVGFPTLEPDGSSPFTPRELMVLRSDAPASTNPTLLASDDDPSAALRYFRMVPGWSKLGGASGGPVVSYDEAGRPGVSGILLGRVEYRGFWRRGRAIVAHRLPPQAYLAATGALDALPDRTDRDAMLVQVGATLSGDGNRVPQRQAASGR